MLDDTLDVCVVCNKKIDKENKATRHLDGLCLCSNNCVNSFLREKKRWTPENWDAICRLQLQYEERKRVKINNFMNSPMG